MSTRPSLITNQFLSGSALAGVLKDISENGLPSAKGRSSIKRGRDTCVDIETPYGKLIVVSKVYLPPVYKKGKKGQRIIAKGKHMDLAFVNPLALLYHACENYPIYASLVAQCFEKFECSATTPFNIICYADEVSCGNVLRHSNGRKLQACNVLKTLLKLCSMVVDVLSIRKTTPNRILKFKQHEQFYIHCFPAGQSNLPKVIYWSIKEYGIEALGLEQNWFLLSACRSSIVRRLPGKMSEFFKMCLLQFYCPVDLRLGAQLQLHGQSDRAMIFCRVGVLLGDEGALKEVLEMKGAAGSKLCCLCSNLVDHKSGIAECDTTHTLVKSTELDVAKIQRHSDESILETLHFLREQRDLVNQEEFKKLQQYCGFNFSPRGTLMCETLSIQTASCVMYDWMHTYVSNGLWNLEMQLLAQTLHDAGVSLDMLHSDLQGFCWPSFIKSRGMTGQSLFAQCQIQDIKCSASEALSVYSIIRWILVERRVKGELCRAELAVDSYLRLCRVLDLLINIK